MSFDPPPEKKSNTEIRVYATIRSGHHGFMKWLMAHYKGETLMRHNVSRIDWPTGPYVFSKFNYRDEDGKPLPTVSPWTRDLYILNVEDADLATVRQSFEKNEWLTKNGESRSVKEILVLRDPYNCFASIYKALGDAPLLGTSFKGGGDLYVKRGSVIDTWKQHAREFLNPTLIPGAIHVDFTRWMNAQAYRRDIARQLGLEFTDAMFGVRGMSSSFDGKFENARDLKLFDRWRVYQDDAEFRAMFDEEVHDLAGRIFGESVKLPRGIFST